MKKNFAFFHTRNFAQSGGFSLLELIASLTILFIVTAIAYPHFAETRTQLRVSEDARTIVLALGELRAEAIRLKRPVRISFTTTTMSWDIYDDGAVDDTYTLSGGTEWDAVPADIVFNGFGLARGIVGETTLTVTHGTYEYNITVNSNGHVSL